MSPALPELIDPWRAAGSGESVRGQLQGRRLTRLGEAARLAADARVTAEFSSPREGYARVALRIEAELEVTCQRCLEPLRLPLAVDAVVLLAATEEEARALEAQAEAVVCAPGTRLSLTDLVEDEMLLALPFAPTHPLQSCHAAAPQEPVPDTQQRTPNPFAVLANWHQGEDNPRQR